MSRRLKLAVVIVSWCLTAFATAGPMEKRGWQLPDHRPLDEYGYGQTLESDRLQTEEWIKRMNFAQGMDSSEFEEQIARNKKEYTQRLRQNKEHFLQRVAEERSRHPIADGDFTPANDADYVADIRQIQLDFEQRMTEVNEWEKQAHPAHRDERPGRLRRKARQIREQAMKTAYERHDMRKGEWNDLAAFYKRQLAIRRHEKSVGLA
ncbi:MAG: hypothetical protein M1826_005806 [Phylliscum demangeonii]|nr:MAG: hypothetical protein M1826_005806 [Phylliscum demangeonii]